MSINIIIQFGWRLGKGKLFWFLLTSLHFLSVFVNASHFRVGFCVGKNQMCCLCGGFFVCCPTCCGLAEVAIFITNVDAENKCLINHKTVFGTRNPAFWVGAVSGSLFFLSDFLQF